MKNTLIFLLLLLTIVGVTLLATRDTSRKATVNGIFAKEFEGIDYKWIYLRADSTGQTLDSCLIVDHRFTLGGEFDTEKLPCRIVIPASNFETSILLAARQEVELRIQPDPEYYSRMAEQALREALARLDSAGVSIPDSLWQAIQAQKAFESAEQTDAQAGN